MCVPNILSSYSPDVEVARSIKRAQAACALSNTAALELAAKELAGMGGRAQAIGLHYMAVLERRRGNIEVARAMFTEALRDIPQYLRAACLMSLARTFDDGFSPDAIHFYKEALREGSDQPAVVLGVRRMDAIRTGDLDLLYNLCPLAYEAATDRPDQYLDHLNSLSDELRKAGYLNQARGIIRLVLRMPEALVKPAYRRTAEDIERSEPPMGLIGSPGSRSVHCAVTSAHHVETSENYEVETREILRREPGIRKSFRAWVRKNLSARKVTDILSRISLPRRQASPQFLLDCIASVAPIRGPSRLIAAHRGSSWGSVPGIVPGPYLGRTWERVWEPSWDRPHRAGYDAIKGVEHWRAERGSNPVETSAPPGFLQGGAPSRGPPIQEIRIMSDGKAKQQRGRTVGSKNVRGLPSSTGGHGFSDEQLDRILIEVERDTGQLYEVARLLAALSAEMAVPPPDVTPALAKSIGESIKAARASETGRLIEPILAQVARYWTEGRFGVAGELVIGAFNACFWSSAEHEIARQAFILATRWNSAEPGQAMPHSVLFEAILDLFPAPSEHRPSWGRRLKAR